MSSVDPGDFGWWVDLLVDLCFLVDIVLNFYTGYNEYSGVLVYERRKICRRYCGCNCFLSDGVMDDGDYTYLGWFWIDVVSCLPITYLQQLDWIDTEENSVGRNTKFFRILRLLRLAKLLRLARFKRMLERYAEDLKEIFAGLAMAKAVFLTLGLSHFCACAWHFLGQECLDERRAEGCSDLIMSIGNATADGCQGCWLDGWLREDATLGFRYATSLYWAATTLSTVGYGDILPVTKAEMIFTIFAELIGTCVFAHTAAVLSAIIMDSKLDPSIAEYNKQMPRIKEYLRKNGIAREARRQILEHFHKVFTTHKVVDEEEILDMMPPAMARDVVLTVNKEQHNMLNKTKSAVGKPLFFSLDHEVLVDLIRALEPINERAGAALSEEGKLGAEVHFILTGEAQMLKRYDIPNDAELDSDPAPLEFEAFPGRRFFKLKDLGRGDMFGEMSALGHGGGPDGNFHTHSVVATTEMAMCFLSREKLKTLCENYPQLLSNLQMHVHLRRSKDAAQERAHHLQHILHSEARMQAEFDQLRKSQLPADAGGAEPSGLREETVLAFLQEKLRQLGGSHSLHLTKSELSAAVSAFDTDRNGMIDFPEFMSGIQSLKDPSTAIPKAVDAHNFFGQKIRPVEYSVEVRIAKLEEKMTKQLGETNELLRQLMKQRQ